MRHISIIITLFLAFAAHAQDDNKLILEGQYHQKNIYVNNPISSAGVGFCVFEVRVNGEITTDEVNSSAFEIDFKQLDLEPGDDVLVEIMHKDGCEPKVLNPDVLKPRATFKIKEIKMTEDGNLKWMTTNEKGRLPFTIQQFKWNKWVDVGEVQGKGTPGEHSYQFKPIPVPGKNRFRVKQEGMDGKEKISRSVEYVSDKEEVDYDYKRREDKLYFSRETSYELYNMYGEIIKKGYGKILDLSNFKDGTYYLNYGSKTIEFKKR